MKKTSLLLSLLLAGCIGPQKAASIEDYCDGVAAESKVYTALLKNLRPSDLKTEIRFRYGPEYPAREVAKMLDVVDMVASGSSANDIHRTCITQRTDGTWFKEAV